jgi:hypothetical protein
MRNLSKFVFVVFSLFLATFGYLFYKVNNISAQTPGLHFPCDDTSDNEFNSLRPYQASPCGPYPKQALFCSNKLVIFESFQLKSECSGQKTGCTDCKWTCNLNYQVEPHNLNITLDESELPIMGNTQDEFDDAQKVNEYASWYLSGVNDKRENENATDDQIVNFSGPVKKLLPSMIQDAQKIEVIKSTQVVSKSSPSPTSPQEQSDDYSEGLPDNHDQLVVDGKRLSFWLGDLSIIRSVVQSPLGQGVVGGLLGATGQLLNQGLQGAGVNIGSDAWNMCRPPLPWDNGKSITGKNVTTGETETKPIPFNSDLEYKKAYNEWLGKTCFNLPFVGLSCFDNPFISNKCADLWHYVPLSNNSDSEGKNYLLTGDGPSYVPSQGTEIEDAQHKGFKNALLYFSHMQEVMGLSGLLNKTYTPEGHESEKLPETTEKIKKGISTKTNDSLDRSTPEGDKDNDTLGIRDPYSLLDCSAVNVRVNEGDDLFPGDRPSGKELFVEGAEYKITQVECHEINEWTDDCKGSPTDPTNPQVCGYWKRSLDCLAEVGIEFKTGTKTPLADEIFSQTVADSGSTFRKIFPKVEEGAPVECIADIPTTTNVAYSIDNPLHQSPEGGEQEFKQTIYPADGSNSGTQLTFPHIGSVYEYFLKGIQTALRPKGYGEPLVNGNCKPTEPIECGDWEEKLEKSSGGDCGICTSELGDLAKRILATAGKAYNVPAANIWAAMKHEGADGYQGTTYDFSDENVRKWSNPVECGGEPMPACDESNDLTQPPFGFLSKWFFLDAGGNDTLWSSVQKIDPSRNSKDKVSRCNFLDAAFAAANLLSQVSTAPANGIMGCSKWTSFDNSRPGTCSSAYWTDAHIVQSQTVYAGFCVNDIANPLYTVEDTVSWFNSAKCN